ncbi:MAG: hypothetical protein ABH826_01845 [Patescibacteria group bacterium]
MATWCGFDSRPRHHRCYELVKIIDYFVVAELLNVVSLSTIFCAAHHGPVLENFIYALSTEITKFLLVSVANLDVAILYLRSIFCKVLGRN